MAAGNTPKVKKPRIKMKEQPVEERIRNFSEVPLGYTAEEAVAEASRCIQCKDAKCIQGCPININIKEFILNIANRDFKRAIETIKRDNSLPAVCGRVCPQEELCESSCLMQKTKNPINIGSLERFAADWEMDNLSMEPAQLEKKLDKQGKTIKIAIAGSGPAGLTVAGDLAKMGFEPVIFEALHIPGGVLTYGIPEFRLPKRIVEREVDYLKKLGVRFEMNMVIGKTYSIEDLFNIGYKAIFIGVGAGAPMFMGIPGEQLNGVYSANEFLTRLNAMKAYLFPDFDTPIKLGRKVVVVGGGNVAMDAARWARRLAGVEEVHIVYRRSEEEMPARHEEIKRAKEEGIIFNLLTNPVEIIGNEKGWVKSIKCIQMELTEPDSSGRRRPVPLPGSEFIIEADNVILALGTKANKLLTSNVPGLKLNRWGNIEADEETCATSIPGVYAGGDITTGAATVIAAMRAGRKAAKTIEKYLESMRN